MFHFRLITRCAILKSIQRAAYGGSCSAAYPQRKSLFMLTMQIMKDPKEMIAAVNEQLAARGVYGRVAYAESGQWIDFAMNAAVE